MITNRTKFDDCCNDPNFSMAVESLYEVRLAMLVERNVVTPNKPPTEFCKNFVHIKQGEASRWIGKAPRRFFYDITYS